MKKINKLRKFYAAIDPADEVVNDAINVFAVENGVVEMWDKIKRNSDYPLLVSNVFTFYDPNITKEITEEGKEIMDKMRNSFRKLAEDKDAMYDLDTLVKNGIYFHQNTDKIEKEGIEKMKNLSEDELQKIKDKFKL